MLTIAQAWDALAAAERLVAVHGLTLSARVHHAHRSLFLEIKRGGEITCWVSISEGALNACTTAHEVTDLIEREVAAVLKMRHGSVRA